jgi:hypothetical protein
MLWRLIECAGLSEKSFASYDTGSGPPPADFFELIPKSPRFKATKKYHMTYRLNGNSFLFAIKRTEILDISVNDTIAVEGFAGVSYVWTEHDSEFVENNPDDDIFLQVERVDGNKFRGKGIVLK